jgi:diguanylate cyclase (GGDEF)-like protein/putative nucleotidyltransferase with HDIG domain
VASSLDGRQPTALTAIGAPPQVVLSEDARALSDEAHGLEQVGRRAEARALYERALRGFAEPSPVMASTLLRWIARTYEMDADYQAAADCVEAAVATAEASGDKAALAHALNALALARWREGHFTQAERLLQEALECGTSAEDPRLHVEVMASLGSLAKIRGDLREALRCYQDAVSHGRRHALLDGIGVVLNNLGLANLELDRLDAAEAAFDEASLIADDLGGLAARIQAEAHGALLQVARRDFAEAAKHADRAMELASRLGEGRSLSDVARVYGIIARETDDLAEAEAQLLRAGELGATAADLTLEGEANRELAELYRRQDRNRDTLRALNRAHACFAALSARHEMSDVGHLMSRLETLYLEVVRSWCEQIESKDASTRGHSERVADLASALAAKVGFDEASLFWFRVGALLYDVGKLTVPSEVLYKNGQLTSGEWALVRQHPEAGVDMLADLQFPWDIVPMVRSHHERWDGHGYPDGLAGEAIPLPARILAIADMYDALTTVRSYKRAFSRLEAMEIMRREVGRQFDPQLFARFEELVRRGSLAMRAASQVRPKSGGYVAIDATEEDDLTGALIRRAFVEVTSAVLAERRRTGAPVSLLVVDVDQFKSVNDTFGHLAGDDALRLVAGVAREHLRPGQYLGRYAGDEFVVVLPGFDVNSARALADDIRRTTGALSIPLHNETVKSLTVTVSIGVASAPAHGESFEALFTAADRALFDAKRAGRDKVAVAGSESDGPPQLTFSRFVGRAEELRSLVGALDQSVGGTPQVRLIIGEAGVGKSTLVRQLLPEARLRGAVMAAGRALDAESRAPFGPWAEVVSSTHALGLTPDRPWPLLERLAPSIRAVGAAGDVLPPIDPRHGHQLLHELVAYLKMASATRPLVVALEDMHWADVASWDALEFVLAHLDDARICFAITLRSEEAAFGTVRERRQRLSRDERSRELGLARLTEIEVRHWLQGVLHRSDLGNDLVQFVLRHTEGNPFLVTQLLRTMGEEGVFTHSGSAWTWTIPTSLALPIGMSDLVGRRLSRLPHEALRILVTAAAIGRVFPLDLLASAAEVSMEAVLDAVDSGLASSVLEPARSLDDRDTYQFAHALLVDAVLRSVSAARQRHTHERIANLLAKNQPEAVDLIAAHFARSGNAGQAYTWCRAAAGRAVGLYALDDATQFLALALTHADSDAERAAVYDELARVAELSGRWADVERWSDELLAIPMVLQHKARALSMQLRRLQARIRLGQSTPETETECRTLLAVAERIGGVPESVQTRSLLVQTLARKGEVAEAIVIARESLALALSTSDDALASEAMHRLAITLLGGNPAEAVDLLLQLIGRAGANRDRAMEARAHLTLGVARTFSHDDRAGMAAFRSALALAREAQTLDLAASASMNLGVLELRSGDFAAAQEACTDALRLYTTLRNNASRLIALYNLANLELERSDLEAAMTLYAEAAALAEQLGTADVAIGAQAGVGAAALRLRDVGMARSALATAVQRLGARDDWWFQGRELLESLIIRLAAHDGAQLEARHRFHRAVERLEPMDVYAAAWLVADCAAEIAEHDPTVWAVVERLAGHPAVKEFVPLSARFTALIDMAERIEVARLRTGDLAEAS